MAGERSKLRLLLGTARSEGILGLRDRLLDRWSERRRLSRFEAWTGDLRTGGNRPLPESEGLGVDVLSYLPTPPVPWLGGLQRSLLARRRACSGVRTTALLFPVKDGFRLEVLGPTRVAAIQTRATATAIGPGLRDAALERAVSWAVERVGARILHVESLDGVAFESLLRLRSQALRLAISIHDFSPFCLRPHLLEASVLRFCEYCRDLDRCARCLQSDWNVGAKFQKRYRETAQRILAAADALIFPSDFLRRKTNALFPGLDPAHQWVIAPALEGVPAETAPGPSSQLRHVAFVGQVKPHKGARVLEDLLSRRTEHPELRLRWTVLGGGDREILRRLRRHPGVSVRGYYRVGSLPALLEARKVDLALLLSIVPESYGLALDECRAAGVPVLAFDQGAIADRIRKEGGGLLIPLAEGASGILDRLRSVQGGGPIPPYSGSPVRPEEAAAQHREVYARLS
jgi:glycosyltransferase involved in cell wall biosynthesis